MTVRAMISGGARSVRASAGVVAAVFLVELGASLIFTLATALTLTDLYGRRPLFWRGVEGDIVALDLALAPNGAMLRGFVWSALALLGAWKLVSLYLGAGLGGALAGKGFAPVASARFGAFVRLSLWSLVFYAAAAIAGTLGLELVGLKLGDLASWRTMIGIPLAALAPGLALWLITALAVDYGRAHLVLEGGAATRALGLGLRRALTGRALLHYVLYLLAWSGISLIFVAVTRGHAYPGTAGALLLLAARQLTAGARFVARAVTTGGQIAALR